MISDACYEAAMNYAASGWPVFPTQGKIPVVAQGFKAATADPGKVTELWTTHPFAGIGSPVRDGEFVLDIDPRNGGDRSLEEILQGRPPLPPTLKTRTGGGGLHLRFELPSNVDPSTLRSSLGAGLDVKLPGKGYVILPPSPHASGTPYAWEPYCDPDSQAVAEAPGWLVELLRRAAPEESRSAVDPSRILAGIHEGQRDQEIFKYASSLRAREMPRAEAEVLVLVAAAACKPPFPPDQARAKLDQAWKYPEGKSQAPHLELVTERSDRPGIVSIDEFLAEIPSSVPSLWGDGLLAEKSINVLAGESGIGKTMLVLNLILHLAKGKDFLGLRIPTPRRCLVLEGEGNRDKFRERLATSAAALGIDPMGLSIYFAAPGTDFKIGEDVLEAIKRCRAEVTVLDTIGLFHDGDENSATDWKKFVVKPERSMVEETGTSFMNLHHFSKPTEGRSGGNRIRGTSAMKADSDTTFTLETAKTGKDHRVFTFEKVKNGAQPEPMVLRFDVAAAMFSLTDETAASTTDVRLQAIASWLRDAKNHTMSRASLLDRLKLEFEIGPTTGDELLRAGLNAGLIIKPNYGVYGLPGVEE